MLAPIIIVMLAIISIHLSCCFLLTFFSIHRKILLFDCKEILFSGV